MARSDANTLHDVYIQFLEQMLLAKVKNKTECTGGNHVDIISKISSFQGQGSRWVLVLLINELCLSLIFFSLAWIFHLAHRTMHYGK